MSAPRLDRCDEPSRTARHRACAPRPTAKNDGPASGLPSDDMPKGCGIVVAGLVPFNHAPYSYFRRPNARHRFEACANYDVGANAYLYLEAMFTPDPNDPEITSTSDFGKTTDQRS